MLLDARLGSNRTCRRCALFDEACAAGYTGSLTQAKTYVRPMRPRLEPEPVVRFETAPGVQVQIDFAGVRFPWGKRCARLVILGYSRVL